MNKNSSIRPLVSVCVPVFNGADVIADTIQSLLAQTYDPIEFILVDNGSADNTIEVVKSLAGSRMKIVQNPVNIGAAANWNKCIEMAQGEFIAIYHADDIYEPTIVEKSVQAFLTDSRIGAVFTAANKVDGQLRKIGEINIQRGLEPMTPYGLPEILESILTYRTNPFVCPSCMVRKSVYDQIGGYNSKDLKYAFDLDLYLRILGTARVVFLSERLMNYRVSTSQGSFKYKTENTTESEFFIIMDPYIKTGDGRSLNIDSKYLRQYECQRDVVDHARAVNLLRQDKIEEAEVLFKKSLTKNRFEFALHRFSIFRGLVYTAAFMLAMKLGLGKQLSQFAYKIEKRRFERK